MLPPTVASLGALLASETAAHALEAAAEVVDVPTVQPRVIMDDGGVRIVMPGDPEYDEAYRGHRSLGTWPSADACSDAAVARDDAAPTGERIERLVAPPTPAEDP
jgi:hypothetical protein